MVRICPFKAYRPPSKFANFIASPPYDVINTTEARNVVQEQDEKIDQMVENNELTNEEGQFLKGSSFLRVNKPHIDLNSDINYDDPSVYEQGKNNLQEFITRGLLVQDETPGFYVYTQRMCDHYQRGIVAGVNVEDYKNNTIKKHEKTTVRKERDRIRLTYAQNANVGPIFLMYERSEVINKIIDDVCIVEAETSFIADDGVEHSLWPIFDSNLINTIQNLFEQVPDAYIADGHHRTASANRVCEMKIKEAKERGESVTGEEPFNYFLAVLFASDELKIIGYNRAVKDLHGLTKDEFIESLDEKWEVEEMKQDEENKENSEQFSPFPKNKYEMSMYIDNTWYAMKPKENTFDYDDPVNSLDVCVLYNNCIGPILGVEDERNSERIFFIGGGTDHHKFENHVNSGSAIVLFLVFPVSVNDVIRISNCNMICPPKVTYFEPKLRSGMLVKSYDN